VAQGTAAVRRTRVISGSRSSDGSAGHADAPRLIEPGNRFVRDAAVLKRDAMAEERVELRLDRLV
jgi:hypothetical protein